MNGRQPFFLNFVKNFLMKIWSVREHLSGCNVTFAFANVWCKLISVVKWICLRTKHVAPSLLVPIISFSVFYWGGVINWIGVIE